MAVAQYRMICLVLSKKVLRREVSILNKTQELCSDRVLVFYLIKVFFNKFNIDVSSILISSLCAIVICQKYFGYHVISSQIHLFAPLLDMRRCTQ